MAFFVVKIIFGVTAYLSVPEDHITDWMIFCDADLATWVTQIKFVLVTSGQDLQDADVTQAASIILIWVLI